VEETFIKTKIEVISAMKKEKLVAVVRAKNTSDAFDIVSACVEGGIKFIEITFSVPYAHEVISELSKIY